MPTVIWTPNIARAVNEREHERELDGFLNAYLPGAMVAGAQVVDDDEGWWLVARVWSFDTRRFEFQRAQLPEGVQLP